MAIKKEKFFEIINEVSKSEGLNENNLLERIGNELEKINSQEHTTHNMYSDLKKKWAVKR